MVVCLEQGAGLHMAQLMPPPLTVSCFSKIQIGFTVLVAAYLGSPRKRAVKRVCVCVFELYCFRPYVPLCGCRSRRSLFTGWTFKPHHMHTVHRCGLLLQM